MTNKRINVDYLARVEGEGALRVEIVEDRVGDVQLNIFEPPRFFRRLFARPGITRRRWISWPASAASARWPTR